MLRELGVQYRKADSGKMAWADCAAAARVLREIRFCLESADVEQRLQRLELAAAADPDWPALKDGRDRHAITH